MSYPYPTVDASGYRNPQGNASQPYGYPSGYGTTMSNAPPSYGNNGGHVQRSSTAYQEGYLGQEDVSRGYAPVTGGGRDQETLTFINPSQATWVDPEPGSWKDLWAALLFYAQFITTICLAIWGAVDVKKSESTDPRSRNDSDLQSSHAGNYTAILVCCVGLASLLSYILIQLTKKHPRGLIVSTNLFSVALYFIVAIVMFVSDVGAGGIVFIILALLHLLLLILWRNRIAFAGVTLQYAGNVISKYSSVVTLAFVVLAMQILYFAVWCFAAFAVLTSEKTGVIWVLALFMYWSFGVFRNVVHVTISGTVGAYYFSGNTNPTNPAAKSLKRALTTSFGSICFGSLIVAIVQTLRSMASSMRRKQNSFIACCAECILSCLERLIRYFNMYAFVQVGVYGKPYIQAARDTFHLVSTSGIEAIVNDNLVSPVMTVASFFTAALCFLVAALWSRRSFGSASSEWIIISVIACVLGFIVVAVVSSVIWNAIVATFVCYAQDKEGLRRSDPDTFDAFEKAWYEYNGHNIHG